MMRNNSRFSPMDGIRTEKLIECIQKYPELYDANHLHFRNQAKRSEIWAKLSEETHETSEILKTRWKGLKDGYTKYKRWEIYRNPSSKGFQYWCWAPYLRFLDPYMRLQTKTYNNDEYDTSCSNAENSNDISIGENSQASHSEEDSTMEGECTVKEEQKSAESTPNISRPPSPELPQDPIESQQTEDRPAIVIKFLEAKRRKGIDSIDLLFMSYGDTFRNFSVETQSKLKIKLATMFALAELQEHEATSNNASSSNKRPE